MEKLKYKNWTWPENPETFLMEAVREPEYSKAEDGSPVYQGLSALCRTITGKGIFQGASAADSFKTLLNFLEAGDAGPLIHPVWGTINACLTELKMEEGSTEQCISYTYAFREADIKGAIPVLGRPSNWGIYIY
jgi:hypothetical protein